MRIGIDAKWYYSGPPSGVNVIRNIVDYLVENNNEDYIIFFLNRVDIKYKKHFSNKIANKKNLECVFIPGKINFLTNLFLFPIFFYKKKLDAILFQNYIPIWGGKTTKYIDYIYDFLFMDFPQYFSIYENIIYRLMIISSRNASHVITISKSEKERIIQHANLNSNKVSFVYPGLDSIFFERSSDVKARIIKKYDLPSNYILYVGRLNIRKNIKTLLKSFSNLKVDISLVIIGKEENGGSSLIRETSSLGIKEKVYILGHINMNDLAELMAAAIIFVFPSFAEGFGLPPLEAMKSGVPTIVSDRTSLPEVCGDSALYFDPDNPEELTIKLNRLLTNPIEYSAFKIKGLKKAQEFAWKNSVENILGIIKKI